MSANLDLNQEQTAVENLLYQRLIIFLIVFSLFVLGAVNSQRKILFLSILFLGVLICWVLTFIIIRTAKKIDNRSGSKLVRFILGYFVPIFCSCLLTASLFFGSFGFVDSYLFPSDLKSAKLENKIDDIKNEVVKLISPVEKKTSNNFKNIDSVIAESKTIPSGKPLVNISSGKPSPKTLAPKRNISSKYFKAIDSVIVSDKPKNTLKKNQMRQQPPQPLKQNKNSKIFKNVDSVIAKEK